jgi:hypothetical protein
MSYRHSTPPELLAAMDADGEMTAAFERLESQALFAQDNYSTALLEGVAALACLEAVHLLEGVRASDLAAQVKDSLEDALASNDPLRMSDAHALALSFLQAKGIEHDLPDATPPGVPLGLRRSTVRPPPRQQKAQARPQRPALQPAGDGAVRWAPRTGPFGRRRNVRDETVLTLMRRTSLGVWAAVLLSVAVLLAFMSRAFARQRAAPIVQSHRIAHDRLAMPVLTFCHPQHGFPAVPTASESCRPVVTGGASTGGLPCPGELEAPLLAVSRLAVARHSDDERGGGGGGGGGGVSFDVSPAVYAAGNAGEVGLCRERLAKFDVGFHKEWNASQYASLACQSCLQVSAGPSFADVKDSVSVELAVDKFASLCFMPQSREILFTRVIPGLAAYLSANMKRFETAGVLDLGGAVSPLEQVPLCVARSLRRARATAAVLRILTSSRRVPVNARACLEGATACMTRAKTCRECLLP